MARSTWTVSTVTALVLILVQLQLASATQGTEAAICSSGCDPTHYRPPIIKFQYHGGPIMWKPIHVYIVWYGTWTENQKRVVRTALLSLTPPNPIKQFPNLSNYWNVLRKYYQRRSEHQPHKFVGDKVVIAKEVDDGLDIESRTINATNDLYPIIKKNIDVGKLPFDPEQGAYFLLTSSDISYTDAPAGIPPPYCANHQPVCVDVTRSCNDIRNNLQLAHVPLPNGGNASGFGLCNLYGPPRDLLTGGIPPNHDVDPIGNLDSMLTGLLHELMELVVNYDLPASKKLRGWKGNDTENSEIADYCAYNFVAGEWYYCRLPSVYPDFNTSAPGCRALSLHPTGARTLTDPKSNVTFTLFGVGGSQFVVQKLWDLDNKGCVLQPEARCPSGVVKIWDTSSGTIQRGFFYNGVGLQAYAPGQKCRWHIKFSHRPMTVTFKFEILQLAYDDLDYVEVYAEDKLVTRLTGFGTDIVVEAVGREFDLKFVTFGERSPYPISAGFIVHYRATPA